jgi:hypothetical protein
MARKRTMDDPTQDQDQAEAARQAGDSIAATEDARAAAKARAAAGQPPEGDSTVHGETVPGGRYIRDARPKGGKLIGGTVVNAEGVVLATFDDDRENTGNPEDGDLTDEGKKAAEEARKAARE